MIHEFKIGDDATLFIRPKQADIWVENYSKSATPYFGDVGIVDIDKDKLVDLARWILETMGEEE